MHVSIFKAMQRFKLPISWLRDFMIRCLIWYWNVAHFFCHQDEKGLWLLLDCHIVCTENIYYFALKELYTLGNVHMVLLWWYYQFFWIHVIYLPISFRFASLALAQCKTSPRSPYGTYFLKISILIMGPQLLEKSLIMLISTIFWRGLGKVLIFVQSRLVNWCLCHIFYWFCGQHVPKIHALLVFHQIIKINVQLIEIGFPES